MEYSATYGHVRHPCNISFPKTHCIFFCREKKCLKNLMNHKGGLNIYFYTVLFFLYLSVVKASKITL